MASDVSPKAIGPLWKPPKREKTARRPLKQKGKIGQRWDKERAAWIQANPPDYAGNYDCYYGDGKVHVSDVTLEHVKNRGSHPELRFDPANFGHPAHGICNIHKKPMMHTLSQT